MLELVHNDPRGWLRNYCRRNSVPDRAPEGTGYVYVVEVTGRMAYIKAGSTAQPRKHFEALRTEAHRLGAALTRAWLSPAHPTYQGSETHALRACRALSPSTTPRGENFPDLGFVAARREAVKAVLGLHSTPGISTITRAAGPHESIPAHVQQLITPNSSESRLRQMAFFAQGSCRTRFRRRSAPNPAPRPQESDLLYVDLLRQLRLPSASVTELSSRRQKMPSTQY
jgi:hypothetical protein